MSTTRTWFLATTATVLGVAGIGVVANPAHADASNCTTIVTVARGQNQHALEEDLRTPPNLTGAGRYNNSTMTVVTSAETICAGEPTAVTLGLSNALAEELQARISNLESDPSGAVQHERNVDNTLVAVLAAIV